MKYLIGKPTERVNGKVNKDLKEAIIDYRLRHNKMGESEFLRVASATLINMEKTA